MDLDFGTAIGNDPIDDGQSLSGNEVPGLDPVCTECGEPFDQKWLERLISTQRPINRDRSV